MQSSRSLWSLDAANAAPLLQALGTLILEEEEIFTHPDFDRYQYDDVPLDRDIYLVDGGQVEAYHDMVLGVFSGAEYDYQLCPVTYAAARAIRQDSIELSWYPNVYDRFHEVIITLPKSEFVACVGAWSIDEKPRIFVGSDWLHSLLLRSNSIFALVDAAGVKQALFSGALKRSALLKVRERLDALAATHEDVLFISFADSVLIKSSWNSGYVSESIEYRYNPEVFFEIAQSIEDIYMEELNLATYMILSQGTNEYYSDPLHHVSADGNHISLNSLGIPFAILMDIEAMARQNIRSGRHEPAELYMDEVFLRSLRLKHTERNSMPGFGYNTKMSDGGSRYYLAKRQFILANIEKQDETGA